MTAPAFSCVQCGAEPGDECDLLCPAYPEEQHEPQRIGLAGRAGFATGCSCGWRMSSDDLSRLIAARTHHDRNDR